MLYYAAVLFAVALIAAVFGFTGIASGASGIVCVLRGALAAGAMRRHRHPIDSSRRL